MSTDDSHADDHKDEDVTPMAKHNNDDAYDAYEPEIVACGFCRGRGWYYIDRRTEQENCVRCLGTGIQER